jgi:hypothetical protein
MLAAGQIEPLKQAYIAEELERTKHRCATQAHPSCAGIVEQVGRGEVSGSVVDQLGHRAARAGDTLARALKGTQEVDLFGGHG